MTVDCKQFEAKLLDLAYDELEENEADELRTHASTCPICRESLGNILLTRKLAAQLPALEPGNDIDALILEAAAEKQRREPARPEPGATRRAVSGEKASPLIERLRSFLLTPALVTAAVAFVVLIISVFLTERGPLKAGRTVGGKEEPVALSNGAQDNRRRSAPEPVPEPARPPQSVRQNGETRTRGVKDKPVKEVAPEVFLDSPDKESARGVSPVISPAAKGPDSPSRRSLREQEHEGTASERTGPSDFREGMEAYGRGDCDTATRAFEHVIRQPSSPRFRVELAIHHLARCERRRGRCAQALPWYDNLISKFPGYPGRAEALWEAAQCQRRLGHVSEARDLLEDLSEIPGWGSRARRALGTLEAEEE